MVLELLAGGSLEDRLHDTALPDDETRSVAAQVAAGLAHAHEHGLVHRDLKPSNILFDSEGRAKIADFGIVRVGGGGTLTEAGTVLGTASYISPEQAAGLPAGAQSDVYSFGVILFRLLTGRLPFVSKNAMELVRMHRDEPPPSVASVRADAPAELSAIVAACLVKEPAHRPRDGAALAAALRGDDTSATQVLPAVAPPPPSRTRRPALLPIALGAAVLLVAGAALAFAVTRHGGADKTPTVTAPGLSLPTVPSATGASTTASTTTATTTTTTPTTTAETTTAPTTTQAPTTAPTTTAPTTTAPATTTAPTTTTPATTTAPTTTPTTTTTPAGTTTAPTTT
jgi:eukaryotic-like serine/threonine-protein kinase